LASEFKIKGVIYLFTAVNLKSDYHLSASTESKWTICISKRWKWAFKWVFCKRKLSKSLLKWIFS